MHKNTPFREITFGAGGAAYLIPIRLDMRDEMMDLDSKTEKGPFASEIMDHRFLRVRCDDIRKVRKTL